MSEQNEIPKAQICFQESFKKFLQHLDDKQSCAWKNYETLRQKLVRFFRTRRFIDPEEMADTVMDRIADRPDIQDIVNIEAFAFAIARNVGRETKRRIERRGIANDLIYFSSQREILNIEDLLIEKIDQERKKRTLRACIQRLRDEERQLLVSYYFDTGNRSHRSKNIAQQLAISRGAVRCKISRLLARIRQFPELLLFREAECR